MAKKYRRCLQDVPDCEHCPFPDCKATTIDINRQLAVENEKMRKERDENIVNAYKQGGTSLEGLADRYGLTVSRISKILNTNGIYVHGPKLRKNKKAKKTEGED